ncbi:MAG: methyltransferase domain-containing protein [Myxococcota bacterium]|jgi:dolichol-phosphate mannosyltransferase|nr:methyltransferase domain-containing protein [Myxococcota bacterium]
MGDVQTREQTAVFHDGLVSIVSPAWNEAPTMPEFLRRIRAALDGVAAKVEIIIVVPSPEDPTAGVARANGAQVIYQKRPGYGGALKEGLLAAKGEYVVTMDADLSHPPESIPDILCHRGDAEIIIGSRWIEGGSADMSAFRFMLSKILNAIYRRALAVPVLDMSSGFRVYHRRILEQLDLESEKYDILEEILVKCYSLGWRVAEVPFDYQPRIAGESHASAIGFAPHFLLTLVRLWSMRNTFDSADYDSRAYDSLVPPQRYWQRKRYDLLKEMSGRAARKLDIGCGSGRFIQSEPETVGLDIALPKLRFLRRTNPKLVRATCSSLPFADASFDVVVNSQLIEHVPYDREIFREMNRVLEPGGTLVVGTPDYGRLVWRITEAIYKFVLPYGYGDDHITHYTRFRLLEELAAAGFATLGYRYVGGGELIVKCIKREEL